MASRRQTRAKAPAVRPTYDKILDRAVEVLNEVGFDRFNVQQVLEAAGVSRATMYRYFSDVDGLIEAALVETFRRQVDLNLNLVTDLMDNSTSIESFREGLRGFFRYFSSIPPGIRLRRTHTIALAATRPELARAIGEVQELLTDGWEAAFVECQRRGFVRTDIDARAAAVMVQSMAIGRVVDDAATTHLDNERWARIYFDFVDRAVIAPNN